MKTVGIICEYNPFHNGHLWQFQKIWEHYGRDSTIICLMSGNFVQRGMPAIIDKSIRAQAAVRAGADLVLELPPAVALSSAEGFAMGGTEILSRCCDALCFGTESMERDDLVQTAQALLSPAFPPLLKQVLSSGCSFPAARQEALRQMGIARTLSDPNDILGVEYVKAILASNGSMDILPVHREGAYHAEELTPNAPSATAIRKRLLNGGNWRSAVPSCAAGLLEDAPLHALGAGERAIVSRLRTMTEDEFARLPFGSEGLWRRLMKASRGCSDLSSIIDATKSKRYTRTRIDRMILCAFLGLSESDIGSVPDMVRVLAFTDRGRAVLRNHPEFRNAGENVTPEETHLGSLYGLFCLSGIEPPNAEEKRRVFYLKESE